MTPEVEQAILELKRAYPESGFDVEAEEQGGGHIIINNIPLTEKYAPDITWVGFTIPFQYPAADVYPHFIDGQLKFNGESLHGDAISATQWRNRNCFQISRKSNRLNPAEDTALAKLDKVLAWLRNR